MRILKTASGKKTVKISKSEWSDIGKKAGWIKMAQFQVVDDDFNRSHYKDIIGKTFDSPPSYAHVKKINEMQEPISNEERGFKYYINLDERGEFYADVRNEDDDTVFEIKGYEIFENGYMKHKNDLDGLKNHLVDLGVIEPRDYISKAN